MLFSTTALPAFTTIVSGAALPIAKGAAVTDAGILQYALTIKHVVDMSTAYFTNSTQLEHIESVIYKQALSTMPISSFTAANFSASFQDQFRCIAHDEEGHIIYFEAGFNATGA